MPPFYPFGNGNELIDDVFDENTCRRIMNEKYEDNMNRVCRVCKGKDRFSFSVEPNVSLICGYCINKAIRSKDKKDKCLICRDNSMDGDRLVCYDCKNNLTITVCENEGCSNNKTIFNKMCDECWKNRYDKNKKKKEDQVAADYFRRSVEEKEKRETITRKRYFEEKKRYDEFMEKRKKEMIIRMKKRKEEEEERRRIRDLEEKKIEEERTNREKLINDVISIVSKIIYPGLVLKNDNNKELLRIELRDSVIKGKLDILKVRNALLHCDSNSIKMCSSEFFIILNKWKDKINKKEKENNECNEYNKYNKYSVVTQIRNLIKYKSLWITCLIFSVVSVINLINNLNK